MSTCAHAASATAQRVPTKEKDMVRDFYAHVIGVDTSGGEPRSIRLKVTALLPRPVAPVHPALRLEVVAEHAHGSSLKLHRHRPGHGLLHSALRIALSIPIDRHGFVVLPVEARRGSLPLLLRLHERPGRSNGEKVKG